MWHNFLASALQRSPERWYPRIGCLQDKEGMPVRIIKKGPLFGITGKLMRYGSRHYVAIEMPQSTALLKVSYTWCEFVSE